ncbi:MAG: glycosyltransferase family 39 protein [Chitinophagales bacterium]
MLRSNPVLPYDAGDWTGNHIWLHKQPVFLWQMALSIRIFGANEFAVRFPSALMGALMIPTIYRVGKLSLNSNAGYFGSLFFCFSFFQLERTTGLIGMDHNDIAFTFYCFLSIWAYTEYLHSGKRIFIYLCGVFSGLSILNKWLVGLIVYGIWSTNILLSWKDTFKRKKEIINLCVSLGICLVTFLPWQLYISTRFPLESALEYSFNRRHITETLEGHIENNWYYLRIFGVQYYWWSGFFLIIGIVSLFRNKISNFHKSIYLFTIGITYLFFSIIVSTKSIGYVFYVAPLILLLVAYGFDICLQKCRSFISNVFLQKSVVYMAIVILCFIELSYPRMIFIHGKQHSLFGAEDPKAKSHNTAIYKELDSLAAGSDLVINCRSMEDIEAMFYSHKNVYHWWPTEYQIDSLQEEGYRIAAFPDMDGQVLPDYIKSNTKIRILPAQLK